MNLSFPCGVFFESGIVTRLFFSDYVLKEIKVFSLFKIGQRIFGDMNLFKQNKAVIYTVMGPDVGYN